jgi:uncharacterized protein (DUF1800 family)
MPADAYTKMAHLLRRAAFGARPDEITNVYLKQGFEATVDQLVYYENVEENPALRDVPSDTNGVAYDITYQSTNSGTTATALTMDRLAGWWIDRMIKTRRPLLEHMALFWHDHFATSYSKVSNSKYLYWQLKLIREQATGDFRTLLKGINRDPAMIIWLDSNLNTKNSPNENYARELFELFALGFEGFAQGAYTEADVQQAARAFTGWRFRRNVEGTSTLGGFNGQTLTPEQLIDIPPANDTDGNNTNNSGYSAIHDYNNKTVFGVTQNFNGDDIVDLLFDREPQRTFTAKFITKKLWEYFAYENPEPHVVEHLAEVAKRTNFNFKAVLRDMFLNVKEFYSDKAIQTQIKQPIHFLVSASRLLEAVVSAGNLAGTTAGTVNNNLRAMGQWLFWPPDVAGWVGGAEWAATSQYFARANWANALATNRSTTAGNTGIPVDAVLARGGLGATATAEQVVDYFTNLLIQRPLAANVRQGLVDYLKKTDAGAIGTFTLDTTTKNKKVRGLIHLLLSRPEFQVW